MSKRLSWPVLHSVIFSRESADGHTPCDLPDGPTTDRCGQDLAPVSRSAQRVRDSASQTTDISHQHGSTSLTSADLQASLESRLRRLLPKTGGSILYSMHWKEQVTPAGRRLSRLVASVRRTSGKDFGLLLAGWPTAKVQDTRHSPQNADNNLQRGHQMHLPHLAGLAGWPTATTRDHKDGAECPNVPVNALLGREVWGVQPIRLTTRGQLLTGSTAGMASGGQLNPEHSRWLMGYPAEWGCCGATAMQSFLKSQRKSSNA